MDIHLNFPQDKWAPWRSLPPTDFPLLPLSFPVAKLFSAGQADVKVMHLMSEIHKIYCDQSTILRVNPKTKPFLATVLHLYNFYGDIQEELHDTREKLKKMTELLEKVNKFVDEVWQRAPIPNPAANRFSQAITKWRRKKMFLTALKSHEPLLLEVVRIGEQLQFLQSLEDKSVFDVYRRLYIKRAAIGRIIVNAEEQMTKIYLPENQRALDDFEQLVLTPLMDILKSGAREQCCRLSSAQHHLDLECLKLTWHRLANNPYEDLKTRQCKRYLIRLGFEPRKLNRELLAAFRRIDFNFLL